MPLEPLEVAKSPSALESEVAKGSAEAIFDAQEFGDFLIYPQAGSSESSGSSFGTIKIQYPFEIAKFMLQIDIPSGYLYNIAMENHHF